MDGLEAVELKLSEVLINNDSNRFDSEHFKKSYLQEDIHKFRYENIILGQIAFITDGQHGYHEVDDNSNIAHITAKNTRNWFADKLNVDMLAKWVDEKNKRSSLKEKDILLSTRGTVGQCSLVTKEILPANIDQDLVRICILDNKLNPYYLLTYFNSKFGQDWTLRNSTGMVQQGITIGKVKNCSIPILSVNTQITIEELVKSSYKKLEESKQLYKEAEESLLSELGLLDFVPNDDNIAIKSFADSFSAFGRLDSEYYQPKYDDVINKIKNYHNGYDLLYSACKLKDNNFNPQDGLTYNYIELSDIGNTGEISGCTTDHGANLPTRARRIVKARDVIISSIEGSLDKVALVPDDYDDSLCSTGFYVINSEQINSYTLLVLFKNKIFQQLLKQCCSGTILTAINKDEFLNIPVPLIDEIIQKQIEAKIKQSFILKKQSKQLLELAKRAVEVAIEESEQSAMELINNAKY